jgi:DNA-binding HxlR family transcriptional regulator
MPVFEVVSRKWAREVLVLLREGDRRFREMYNILSKRPGRFRISTRSLSTRLREMEEAGLVRRMVVEGWPPCTTYSITDRGRRALSLIEELDGL